MLNVRLLTVALLVAGSFTLLADEPVAAPDAPHPVVKSRNRVYAVADLVVPIRNDVTMANSAGRSAQPDGAVEQCRSARRRPLDRSDHE